MLCNEVCYATKYALQQSNVSISIESMYQEYKIVGYQTTLKNYIQIISEILNTYRFKVNLDNIFPFIKPKTFSTTDINHGNYSIIA